MNNILIINKTQFGYHTDYYKYCEYLKDDFTVTYLCFDTHLKKLSIPDVKVVYVPYKGSKTTRGIRFILYSLFFCLRFSGIVFIHYFEHCQILKKLLPWKKMILDIRTLSISPNEQYRNKYDKNIKRACQYFNHITVISKGIQQKLELESGRSSILPLGADPISNRIKNYSTLKLLYVGTLNGRDIKTTINGFHLFCKEHPEVENITYDIIGDGEELDELRQLTDYLGISHRVFIHGRIPHFELQPFFDKCNVGISYVPMTEYYEHQPVTKTYEYIQSGLITIATKTYCNIEIVSPQNGVLISDNKVSFAKGLEYVFINRLQYSTEAIIETTKEYTWANIVLKYLPAILKKVN